MLSSLEIKDRFHFYDLLAIELKCIFFFPEGLVSIAFLPSVLFQGMWFVLCNLLIQMQNYN